MRDKLGQAYAPKLKVPAAILPCGEGQLDTWQ
jgi:hypothetical protein